MKARMLIILRAKVWCIILLFYNLQYVSSKIAKASDSSFLVIDSCTSRTSIEGEGTLLLQNKTCLIYNIEVQLTNKSSIVQLIPVVIKQNSTTHQNESTENENNQQISVNFYELSLLENGDHTSKIPINLANWKLKHLNDINNFKYLSRTAFLTIQIALEGDWMELEFGLAYQELKFESNEFTYMESKGVIMQNSPYRPNSVSIHQLFKPKDMNKSSIDITVSYINIDDGVGEYLLIGAGTKITPEDDDLDQITPEDVLESIPVCIYNITAASEEFKKMNRDKMFEDFRMILADIANKYADNNNLPAKNFQLKSTAVELFRVTGYISSEEFPDDPNYSVLYVRLKIQGTEKGKAAFTWKHLEKIFEIYLEQESNRTAAFGYKVKKCPADGDYSLWWRIGIYATIPIFIGFYIAVWAWKNNHFSKYCSYEQKTESKDDLLDSESAFYTNNEKQDQVSQSLNSVIEENEYVRGPKRQSGPPVPLRGSSYRGVAESSEENSASEVSNKLSIQLKNSKKVSKEPRSGENSLKKTEPQRSTFYNDADSKNVFAKDLNETQKSENEVEHFYDSVASSIKINRTQLKETYL